MAQEDQEGGSFDVNEAYTRTEAFIEKNKKIIIGAVVLIVGLVAAYFSYQRFYLEPMNKEAGQEMWKAEYYFSVDSLQKAIRGDQAGYKGFQDIVEDYGGTKRAGLAHYYLAVSHLHSGNSKKAADHALQVEVEDELVEAMAKGIAGEAYVELGRMKDAIAYFKKAASRSDNGLTRPLYLKKAALVLEEEQRYEEALELYERIRDEHPGSEQGRNIEKYIGRAEAHI